MKDQEEIPKPEQSGSSGDQAIGGNDQELVVSDQLSELPIAHTIQGIAASNSRAFGSEVASALVAGATSQLASELQYSKNEVSKLYEKNEHLNQQLSEKSVENAILRERLSSHVSMRHLRNFGIAAGTTLLTASFALLDSEQLTPYGYGAALIGALLVLAGWFLPAKGGK
nr:hypothetical protein [uncultured bacterium]